MFGGATFELLGLHHIGDMNRTFAFDDLALRVLLTFAHMLLDHAHAFDEDTLRFGLNGDDASVLAFIGAGNDHHLVVLFHM